MFGLLRYSLMLVAAMLLIVAPSSAVFASQSASASPDVFTQRNVCQAWSQPQVIGELDAKAIPESSGLIVSRQFPDRLYHINDKGNKTIVVMTTMDGSKTSKIEVKGHQPLDTEEIALGPCEGGKSCIYIGDIGDNEINRDSISVAWIEEKSTFRSSEQTLGKVELRYPDGPHNAESMVVHPNGDLFIFTKGLPKSLQGSLQPSYAFKISAAELHAANGSSADLEAVGVIDVPNILKSEAPGNRILTGASISDDGRQLLLLTYTHVIEMNVDLLAPLKAPADLREDVDYSILELAVLPKQEAISYLPGTRSFLVTTESKKKNSPILRLNCQR